MRALTAIFITWIATVSLEPVDATEVSDAIALHQIFQEETLEQNALEICKQGSRLPAEQRFEMLARWVLPDTSHPTFRMVGDHHSTNPAPPVDFRTMSGAANERDSPVIDYLRGKESLAVPALELIDAARESDRLRELRDRILSFHPDNIEQQRSQLGLLFMVEIARQDYSSAGQLFEQFTPLNDGADRTQLPVRWRELVIMWSTLPDERAREIIGDYFFSHYHDLTYYFADQQFDVLTDYLRILQGIYFHLQSENAAQTVVLNSLHGTAEFVPFGFDSAFNFGKGRANALWELNPDGVRKIAGHEQDFLSYRTPLRGNYVVECDVTSDPGRINSFMAGGTRIDNTNYNGSLNIGHFRFGTDSRPLNLEGFEFKDTVRHRAVIRDGRLTHYINGFELFQREVTPDYSPWVALSSWRRSQGAMRNLRITGEPEVPAELNLTADPDLEEWVPYYEGKFGDVNSFWFRTREPDGGYGLSDRRPGLAGTGTEQLIRYIRPMVEGGTVEYDFYYELGASNVHPAFDRLALLLYPDGVRIHWITDGKYDRSGLDPLNEFVEPPNRRGTDSLPLVNKSWNRVSLSIQGETIQLSLNGQLIYERKLERNNQRTFGLFHYSGETSAHVRNVSWRGNWPQAMPPGKDRWFADAQLDQLDAQSRQLPDHFHHDFRRGIPGELFSLEGDESYFEQQERGVRLRRVDNVGIMALSASLQIEGDYDIVLGYEALETEFSEPRARAGIGLMTQLHNLTEDSCAMYRRNVESVRKQTAAFAHKAYQEDGSQLYSGDQLIEGAPSGRLRLARRGKTVYGLIAEYDSSNYRLVFKHDVPEDDIGPPGLSIVTQGAVNLKLEAVLTELDVHAERIYGLPIHNPAPIRKLLDENRQKLNARNLDLTTQESFTRQFVSIGNDPQEREFTADGVRLKMLSTGAPTQARYYANPAFAPLYDVETDLKINQIDRPQNMGRHSEVTFEALLRRDSDDLLLPVEAALILRLRANGVSELIARVYRPRRGRGITYLPIRSIPIKSPDKLRITVLNKTMYFLYSEADDPELKVLAEYAVDSDVSISNVVLNVQASGTDRLTDVTFQSVTLYENPLAAPPLPRVPEKE